MSSLAAFGEVAVGMGVIFVGILSHLSYGLTTLSISMPAHLNCLTQQTAQLCLLRVAILGPWNRTLENMKKASAFLVLQSVWGKMDIHKIITRQMQITTHDDCRQAYDRDGEEEQWGPCDGGKGSRESSEVVVFNQRPSWGEEMPCGENGDLQSRCREPQM